MRLGACGDVARGLLPASCRSPAAGARRARRPAAIPAAATRPSPPAPGSRPPAAAGRATPSPPAGPHAPGPRCAAAKPRAARRWRRPTLKACCVSPDSVLAGALMLRERAAPAVRHAADRAFQAGGHAVHQRRRALLEGLRRTGRARCAGPATAPRSSRRCPASALCQSSATVAVVVSKRRRQPVQLPLHAVLDGVVQRRRLARDAGHRGFDHRLDRRAGDAGAFGQALLQRPADRGRQVRIRGLGLAVEAVLAGDQALVQAPGSAAPSSPSWPAAGRPARACASACRCSSLKDSSRWWACEKARKVVAIRVSSICAACSRSRRHRADIRPSIADAATPATEVPKARPRPLTGAASEARMACRSSRSPAPCRCRSA